MKETYNWKSLFVALGLVIVGIILCAISTSAIATLWKTLWLSTGCSLVASAIVILAHDFFVERITISHLDDWKIEKIFSTRAEKNAESDLELARTKYCIDGIAFGLSSFRSKQTPKVEACLRNGVNIRILTMDPESPYVSKRDEEEHKVENSTKHSIEELVKWANKLNEKNCRGRIIIKGYSCMTLDFYWRIDNDLYVGPYWYGVESQQTITYKFNEGGKGFQQYTEYFESLWDDDSLCRPLTKINELLPPRKKRKS